MKVLVATSRTQRTRKNDYNFCIEGELVWIGLVCRKDAQDPDGGCGCGRGFGGLSSHRATTTARVAEIEMSPAEYAEALRSSLEQQGYGADALCSKEADILAELVADWPVGAVVERRLDVIQVRAWPHELADHGPTS
jgi:hypothetical protein